MASGYEFEDDIIELLLPGFDNLEKDVKVPSGVGERKEVDVVAYKIIPPFGEIVFLIECKVPKIDKSLVEDFISKIKAIREGSSKFSGGVPIMIGKNGYTETAPDYATPAGITLLSFDSIKDVEYPQPLNIAVMINKLDHEIHTLTQTGGIYTSNIYGDLKPLKSKLNYKIRGIGSFDIYAELENKKNFIFMLGQFVGKATENQLFKIIKKIEDFVKKQQDQNKKNMTAFIGFYVESMTDEDKKLLNSLKKCSEFCKIVFIEGSSKKSYGDVEAKSFFNP